jgi:Thioredoxin
MEPPDTATAPPGHTSRGGVLIGAPSSRRRLVVFEDPQCPYCRQFEQASGDLLRREVAAGAVSVEYRMRSMLGPESVRANNALTLAAEADRFDQLRRELFAAQPREHTGGFTVDDLVELGRRAGLTGADYVNGVHTGRYQQWSQDREEAFRRQNPSGTPAAFLDGRAVASDALYDADQLGALVRG